MLKLQLTHEQHGPSQHDSNVAPEKISAITMVEFVKRYEGVGQGFKGRAPNRCTIWMGENQWRNVVLPDDYNVDTVRNVMVLDSRGVMPSLTFVQSTENDRVWVAQQPQMGQEGGAVPGYQSAPPRAFAVRRAFKNTFDFIGEVGVNDLQYLLNCEIQLPTNHDTEENRNAIYDLADQLKVDMGTPVAANIVVVGATTVRQKEVTGEGHVGAHPQMDRAMAGRQQITPAGYAPGAGPSRVASIEAFATSPEGGERRLQPGQNEQTYGSDGPQDE